jgi:small subunit ribosomal protein S34
LQAAAENFSFFFFQLLKFHFSSIMPVRIIGRPTTLQGKYLFEILRNLKDFGVGRIVARSTFERYPEPSYYIVKSVKPAMDSVSQPNALFVEKMPK